MLMKLFLRFRYILNRLPLGALLCSLVVISAVGCATRDRIIESGHYVISGVTRYDREPLPSARILASRNSPVGKTTEVTAGPDGSFTLNLEQGSYYIMGEGKDPADGSPVVAYWAGNPLNIFGPVPERFFLPFVKRTSPPGTEMGSGIRGRVRYGERPVSGAVVAAYLDLASGLHGPPYMASSATDKDGRFALDVEPGTYFLLARKHMGAMVQSGPLLKGDLSGFYPHNPVTLRSGQGLVLDIAVDRVNRPRGEGSLSPGEAIVLEGIVRNELGEPVEGAWAFLYDSPDMIGRPAFISSPTDSEGRYRLEASRVGSFYLAARSHTGGPPEPGQLMGFFPGSEDHSVRLQWGEHLTGLDIKVLEVW